MDKIIEECNYQLCMLKHVQYLSCAQNSSWRVTDKQRTNSIDCLPNGVFKYIEILQKYLDTEFKT